ncbi:MAG: DUF1330 domain-containing protein [Xanthobacteraceae bacterium]|nr:DUF1330 domain-containing protein [Xanthobacteraceae bacterium]
MGTPPAAGRLKGYWIAHIDVSDVEGYKAYQADVATPFGTFGGRYLIRGGRCEVMEGRMPARTVVVEFPGYEAALACYRSPEYQRSIALRNGHAEANIVAIEAFDPAQ